MTDLEEQVRIVRRVIRHTVVLGALGAIWFAARADFRALGILTLTVVLSIVHFRGLQAAPQGVEVRMQVAVVGDGPGVETVRDHDLDVGRRLTPALGQRVEGGDGLLAQLLARAGVLDVVAPID